MTTKLQEKQSINRSISRCCEVAEGSNKFQFLPRNEHRTSSVNILCKKEVVYSNHGALFNQYP
jgi:hypothetical protein